MKKIVRLLLKLLVLPVNLFLFPFMVIIAWVGSEEEPYTILDAYKYCAKYYPIFGGWYE